MSLRVAFIIDKLQNHTRKQNVFIESRMRKKTLRSYRDYSKERKEIFEVYTEHVKTLNFYMVMFLEFLKNNNNLFTIHKDEYIKRIRETALNVIELYEKYMREKDYLDICDIIKNDVDTANSLYKYRK